MRINNLDLPIDLQLKVFDNTVLPIMLYSCEMWDMENVKILERNHAVYSRRISKTKKATHTIYYMLNLGDIQ